MVVERADALLAFASSCAMAGATACLSVSLADGALPALPPPWAMTLPAPAACVCLGGGFVSGLTVGVGSALCAASGPKGSAMPSASCRSCREGSRCQNLPLILGCHTGQFGIERHDVGLDN